MTNRVVFLLGAGRSGTTLLYKLLSLHQKVAYVSNYDVRNMTWLSMSRIVADRPLLKQQAWFKSSGNAYFVKRPWLKRIIPAPVEGEKIYSACGVPLSPEGEYTPSMLTITCLQKRFERIRQIAGSELLISKRTANNRRIEVLNKIFPEAKYIHLVRDGREVALSLSKVDWWDDHILWWDKEKRKAKQLECDGRNRLEICATNWVEEMNVLHRGFTNINSSQLIEVRYDQLLDNPLDELGRIFQFVGLERNIDYDDIIMQLGLSSQSATWLSEMSNDELELVSKVEKDWLAKLHYE